VKFHDEPHSGSNQERRRIESRRGTREGDFRESVAKDSRNAVSQPVANADHQGNNIGRTTQSSSTTIKRACTQKENDNCSNQAAQPSLKPELWQPNPRPTRVNGSDGGIPYSEKTGQRFVGDVHGQCAAECNPSPAETRCTGWRGNLAGCSRSANHANTSKKRVLPLAGLDAEVFVGEMRDGASAGSAVQETDLDEEWLVDFLDGIWLLGESRR